MKNLILLIFLATFSLSCQSENSKTGAVVASANWKKVVITPDSCRKWGLSPVHFEVSYPENFEAEINPSGGFYVQLRKRDGKNILQEISFGEAAGLSEKFLSRNLAEIDSTLKVTFKDLGQDYQTASIGQEKFLGENRQLLRANLHFKNFTREGFSLNGPFASAFFIRFSTKKPEQALAIGIISSKQEPADQNAKIAKASLEILKTFRLY